MQRRVQVEPVNSLSLTGMKRVALTALKYVDVKNALVKQSQAVRGVCHIIITYKSDAS